MLFDFDSHCCFNGGGRKSVQPLTATEVGILLCTSGGKVNVNRHVGIMVAEPRGVGSNLKVERPCSETSLVPRLPSLVPRLPSFFGTIA